MPESGSTAGDEQSRLRALFDTAVDGMILIDARGIVLMFNPACERLFGFSADEVIGQNVKMLMPTPYRQEHDGYLDNYRRTGHRKIIGIGREVVGQRKDGTTFPMHLSVGEAKQAEETTFVGIIHDLTQQKNAERQAAEERSRLRALFDTAVDGMILIDADGIVLMFNPACEKLFGFTADEVIGQNVKVLMPAPYRQEHDGYIDNYRRTGHRKIIGIGREVVGQRKDGTTFPMHLSVGEAKQSGETTFVGIIHDLTAQKNAERRVRELTAELVHTSRLSAMGQLSSALAHELNQPLTAIMNYSQAARDMLAAAETPVPPRIAELLEKAAGQAERAGQIIRRLRSYVEKGRVERAAADLGQIVEEAAALATIGAKVEGIQITYDLARDLTPVHVDRIQIQQVVVNLVRNAVEVLAGSERRELIIRTRAADGHQEVIVADSGPGLAPEIAAQLFKPFVTTKKSGMGIGLSISHSIIEAHGGRISAEPNPAGGTIFRFQIPTAS
jgi:two-component system sensor kinase FixL